MIGLRRHTVQVVDHDLAWANLATGACCRIREAGGDLIVDCQHVGSTAVPDLPAKPILDLAAAVTTLGVIPELIELLAASGYIYRGDGADRGGHLFVWESEPDVRTTHLHIVTQDDIQWTNYILFRDLLRQNPDLRAEYAALKHDLQARFPDDRESYTDAKRDFILGVLGS